MPAAPVTLQQLLLVKVIRAAQAGFKTQAMLGAGVAVQAQLELTALIT
jgi:hypothetical protein